MKPCPDLNELVGTEGQPADHTTQEHLRGCGRCRAALRAYRAFRDTEGGGDVSDAEAATADRQLENFIETELLEEEPASATELPRIHSEPNWSRGWLAMAAVMVVAVGLWLVGPRLTAPDGGTGEELRGDSAETGAGFAALTVTAVAPGEAVARWEAVEGAQDYEIILWTAALEELVHLEPASGTEQLITWDAAAAPAYFSVVARQGGREIARSVPMSLP